MEKRHQFLKLFLSALAVFATFAAIVGFSGASWVYQLPMP